MKNTLKEYWDVHYFYSGKLSDISRQLSFAGLGIIWFFRTNINDKLFFHEYLFYASILIVLTLFFDIIHYAYGTIVWFCFTRYHENQKNPEDKIDAPRYINWPTYTFFFIKITLLILSYYFILNYISECLFIKT